MQAIRVLFAIAAMAVESGQTSAQRVSCADDTPTPLVNQLRLNSTDGHSVIVDVQVGTCYSLNSCFPPGIDSLELGVVSGERTLWGFYLTAECAVGTAVTAVPTDQLRVINSFDVDSSKRLKGVLLQATSSSGNSTSMHYDMCQAPHDGNATTH